MAGVLQETVGGLLPARSDSAPSTLEEAILAEQVEQYHNRGFQVLYRAQLETAHQAESWEVYQAGSLYHWEGAAGEVPL